MKIAAGRLRDRVTFLQAVGETSARFNTGKGRTFIPFKTVRAEVMDVRPGRSEQVSQGIDLTLQPKRVITRYHSGVTADMRIKIGGVEHDILGPPAELGHRDGLELVAMLISTQGSGA